MTRERDPRVDWRPGDILRVGNLRREVKLNADGIGNTTVTYHEGVDGVREVYLRCTKYRNFRRWAKNAEVIHRAALPAAQPEEHR